MCELYTKFKMNKHFIAAQILSSAKWMIGNYHHRGFYRVNYDANGWKAIKDQLDKDHTVCLLF